MNIESVLTSSFFDKRYAVNKIQRTYQLEYADGTIEDRLDFGDWNITRILRQLTTFTSKRYNGFKKFTTLCYLVYGNTTIYRLILTYNGYMHPYEIPSGALILYPDPAQISNAVLNISSAEPTAKSVIF